MEMFVKCWKHCADFSSRASRSEYWQFFLINLIFTSILSVVSYWLLYDFEFFSKLAMCYSFAALVPGVAVCIRRLHDVGRSGWLFLMILIPVIGLICLFLLLFGKGEAKENDWGSPIAPESEIQ